jgi:hypothetical protein
MRDLKFNRRRVVAFGFLEVLDVGLGGFAGFRAVFFDDGDERLVDVVGHADGIAADVEVGAFLQPGVEFRAVLDHAVLDVDLLRLVARERDVELG